MKNKEPIAVIGAGVVGKRIVGHIIDFGISSFYIGDNNKQRDIIYEIEIDGVDELCRLSLLGYFVSVRRNEDIVKQLIDNGVPRDRIFITLDEDSLLDAIHVALLGKDRDYLSGYRSIVFDYSNGDVLGGVEKWSHSVATLFQKNGYETYCIIPQDKYIPQKQDKRYIMTSNKPFEFEQTIHGLSNDKVVLICNFPVLFFESAMKLKKYFPHKYRVIAVIHNDEEYYYDMYAKYINYIDYVLYISNRMKEKLNDRGIVNDKLMKLDWKIPENHLLHKEYLYDGSVHIGYAGRITLKQKRVDYILKIVKQLYEMKVDFRFDFAGVGDYYKEFVDSIRRVDTENRCIFLGEIQRTDIYSFWADKDIYISTSDWEGRSISKLEAMICGVVPIVTDTSGAADDIENGINGYIVPLGDWELIVRKICVLYKDKSKLVDMATNARRYALESVNDFDEMKLWKKLLS